MWNTTRRRREAVVSQAAPVTVETSAKMRSNVFSEGGSAECRIVWTSLGVVVLEGGGEGEVLMAVRVSCSDCWRRMGG